MSMITGDRVGEVTGELGERAQEPPEPFAELLAELRYRREHQRLCGQLLAQARVDLKQDGRDVGEVAALSRARTTAPLGGQDLCETCRGAAAASDQLAERAGVRRRAAALEGVQAELARVCAAQRQEQCSEDCFTVRVTVAALIAITWSVAHESGWSLPRRSLTATVAALLGVVGLCSAYQAHLLSACQRCSHWRDPPPEVLR